MKYLFVTLGLLFNIKAVYMLYHAETEFQITIGLMTLLFGVVFLATASILHAVDK